MQQYRKTLELDPNSSTTLYFLGRAYEAKGEYDQAVAYYGMSGERSGLPSEIFAELNQVYAESGWKAYLEKSLEQILSQPSNRRFPPFVVASYYARLGRKDEALAWLQRGYEERDFRSEEHTSELQSQSNLVCRLLLEKKKERPDEPAVR